MNRWMDDQDPDAITAPDFVPVESKRPKNEGSCQSEMIQAVVDGDTKKLRGLYKLGYDFMQARLTLLHLAIEHDRLEIVEFLLAELYKNASAVEMGYPLHASIKFGRFHCIKTLLRVMPGLVIAPNLDGVDPILTASSDSPTKHQIINLLIDAGADVDVADCGRSALHYVAMLGTLASVPRLLELSSHINSIDKQGRTPLFLAAEYGNEDNLVLLLGEGADPTIPQYGEPGNGTLPLIVAMQNGHFKVVEILVKVTPHNCGCKAVEEAIQKRQYHCLMCLVKNGFTAPKTFLIDAFRELLKLASLLSPNLTSWIKFFLENGVNFSNVSIPVLLMLSSRYPSVFLKNYTIALCNLGLAEYQMINGYRSLGHTQDFFNSQYNLEKRREKRRKGNELASGASSVKIFLRYFPYFTQNKASDASLSESIIQTLPKLTNICRWHIRSRIVHLHGFVSVDDIEKLPLPPALKNFLCYGQRKVADWI